MEGPEIKFAETVLDNGKYGTRTVRFETGRLAQQAQGAVAAYLDEETMLLSATSAGKHPRDRVAFDRAVERAECARCGLANRLEGVARVAHQFGGHVLATLDG